MTELMSFETFLFVLMVVAISIAWFSIKYDWSKKFDELMFGKSKWEECFFIHDESILPAPNNMLINDKRVLSDDVFIVDESNLMYVGCYNHENKSWHFYGTDYAKRPQTFKWMYKPKALSYDQVKRLRETEGAC